MTTYEQPFINLTITYTGIAKVGKKPNIIG